MSYAKTGIWENWLLEKESVLILISQYSLKCHLDQRVKPAKTKERKNEPEHVIFPNGKAA